MTKKFFFLGEQMQLKVGQEEVLKQLVKKLLKKETLVNVYKL